MDTTVETIEPNTGAVPADTFGHRLMLARAHAGHISIRVAADMCGLGRGAWTNWERGARPEDKIEVAEVVAEKLGVDRDWLLFGGPLAKEERRPGRVLSRDRKEGVVPQPNVFYAGASDHTMRHLPTPASQGSPRLSYTASHNDVTHPRVRRSAVDPASTQRRTARRNRPNP